MKNEWKIAGVFLSGVAAISAIVSCWAFVIFFGLCAIGIWIDGISEDK